jgi:3'-phosphoadenosine 5'-phosphosulfate sulfotransferase (PAPS reductase)/FAD synthetase
MNIEKLEYTKHLIHCWVESWGVDGVYLAYSGGKDSEVLLHIIRKLYPDIPAVFSNTGLEFPEIVSHVRSHDNVIEIRPKMPFHKVIEKYGWPVISKSVSMAISRYRNTKRPDQKEYRKYGKIVNGKKLTAGTIPKKYWHMIDAPFKISDACCEQLKKSPFKRFERRTGLKPMIGIMSGDSNNRKRDILKRGCNVYDAKAPQSRPLANWDEKDVYDYIRAFSVEICSVYKEGYDRTGCVFCMYGLQQEQLNTGENRFLKLKRTHPKQYEYVINKLGGGAILDFMGFKY